MALPASLRYRFPGMDPWLEDRALWRGVHNSLIIDMARRITAQVAPRYVARPEHRMVIETPDQDRDAEPDVVIFVKSRKQLPRGGTGTLEADEAVTVLLEPLEVKETYIEIRSPRPPRKVVAVVEVLSPSNKRTGTDSRAKYLKKQKEVLASDVHLVEIDLLRGGEPTVAIPPEHLASLPPHDYRVVIRRAGGASAKVYPIPLRQRLPCFPVPLLHPDPDAVLDLQELVVGVYEANQYALDMDYRQPPRPPLSREDAAWAARPRRRR